MTDNCHEHNLFNGSLLYKSHFPAFSIHPFDNHQLTAEVKLGIIAKYAIISPKELSSLPTKSGKKIRTSSRLIPWFCVIGCIFRTSEDVFDSLLLQRLINFSNFRDSCIWYTTLRRDLLAHVSWKQQFWSLLAFIHQELVIFSTLEFTCKIDSSII